MDRARLPRALVALCVLLALTATACGRFVRSGTPLPSPPQATTEYGAELEFSPEAEFSEGKGRLTIFVIDQETNAPIAGARVRYRGPEKGSMITDQGGRASKKVKPGTYGVDLPPCGADVLITTAAGATVGVVPRGEAGGPLTTTWEQRFRPTPSVQRSEEPPWNEGEQFELGIRIEDGCDFAPAPHARLTFWAWRISEHFAVAEQPTLTADPEGYLRVTLSCTRRGNGEIALYNRTNPEEEVSLLDAMSAPKNDQPFCK